ncbi:MAG: alpha/beta hydrolase [Acidimicrobiales bacterium]|nr:alpha/beta hydrolase [Acidimicrobiales bacterium]
MNTTSDARYITSPDGTTLALTQTGFRADKLPVVATHGWANDRSVWAPLIRELANDHCIVSWDLRGHGESDTPPPGSYTRMHALADLEAVRKEAVGHECGPVVLMGHSLGGFLSLAYAIDYPEKVAGLVLVATGPGFRKAEAREQWNESVRDSARELGTPAGSEEISMHYDSHVIDRLAQIQVPVLVIRGERDERFAASASLFERDLQVRESVIVSGQGHMVHVKAPIECSGAIHQFIASLT